MAGVSEARTCSSVPVPMWVPTVGVAAMLPVTWSGESGTVPIPRFGVRRLVADICSGPGHVICPLLRLMKSWDDAAVMLLVALRLTTETEFADTPELETVNSVDTLSVTVNDPDPAPELICISRSPGLDIPLPSGTTTLPVSASVMTDPTMASVAVSPSVIEPAEVCSGPASISPLTARELKVPTDVSEDASTDDPSVVELNTSVPSIAYTPDAFEMSRRDDVKPRSLTSRSPSDPRNCTCPVTDPAAPDELMATHDDPYTSSCSELEFHNIIPGTGVRASRCTVVREARDRAPSTSDRAASEPVIVVLPNVASPAELIDAANPNGLVTRMAVAPADSAITMLMFDVALELVMLKLLPVNCIDMSRSSPKLRDSPSSSARPPMIIPADVIVPGVVMLPAASMITVLPAIPPGSVLEYRSTEFSSAFAGNPARGVLCRDRTFIKTHKSSERYTTNTIDSSDAANAVVLSNLSMREHVCPGNQVTYVTIPSRVARPISKP